MKVLRVAIVLVAAAVAVTTARSCEAPTAVLLPTAPAAPGSPTRDQLEDLLAQVAVVPARPDALGYDRSCSAGDSCVFGPAWTDDYDGVGGHDGCDTRNNVLAMTLTTVEFRPGTRDCVVVAGTLADPYSGESLTFTKSDAGAIQIDHIYPLAAAWDMGAAAWPLDRRVQFANDIEFNLMAVNGPDNQSKSDKTPSGWMPPNPSYHCYYAGKYLSVAAQYELPITAADSDTLSKTAQRC